MAKSSLRKEVRIRKILCVTDLSPCSQDALALAAELAGKHGAELLVLHVPAHWERRYDFLLDRISSELETEARAKLSAELRRLGKTKGAKIRLRSQ